MKTRRVKLGQVTVDSGCLFVADPGLIEHRWIRQQGAPVTGIRFWGAGAAKAAELLQAEGYDVTKVDRHVYSLRLQANQSVGEVEARLEAISAKCEAPVLWSQRTMGTLDEVYDVVSGENWGGQVVNLGGAPFGVACTTGFGDGTYDVYAVLRDCGEFGWRVSKLEIEFLPPEERA